MEEDLQQLLNDSSRASKLLVVSILPSKHGLEEALPVVQGACA